jgi:hypothetical protein
MLFLFFLPFLLSPLSYFFLSRFFFCTSTFSALFFFLRFCAFFMGTFIIEYYNTSVYIGTIWYQPKYLLLLYCDILVYIYLLGILLYQVNIPSILIPVLNNTVLLCGLYIYIPAVCVCGRTVVTVVTRYFRYY